MRGAGDRRRRDGRRDEGLSFDAVLVTLAYALGAGLVLLGIAIAGRRGLALPRLSRHAPTIRRVLGAAVLAVAVLMAFNLDTRLQTNLPEYTRALQKLENSNDVKSRLDGLVPGRGGGASRRRTGSATAAPRPSSPASRAGSTASRSPSRACAARSC